MKIYEGTEEPSLAATGARSWGLVRAMVPSVATGRMERPEREHGRRARMAVEIRCQPSRPLLIGATHSR